MKIIIFILGMILTIAGIILGLKAHYFGSILCFWFVGFWIYDWFEEEKKWSRNQDKKTSNLE